MIKIKSLTARQNIHFSRIDIYLDIDSMPHPLTILHNETEFLFEIIF